MAYNKGLSEFSKKLYSQEGKSLQTCFKKKNKQPIPYQRRKKIKDDYKDALALKLKQAANKLLVLCHIQGGPISHEWKNKDVQAKAEHLRG